EPVKSVGESPVAEPVSDMAFDMPIAEVAPTAFATQTVQTDDNFGHTNQEIPSEIGFVSTLDNAQITLDLAKQYLEFGEYESAKHLLNEVAKTGNEEQRQDAINTIRRLG
ncbi:FimV/HubP family polar landmark protein, partial [Moraxella oblonga]|uniref:FimV/HubP family polar landmark protein n=1 Tax=Moraxella oblonga TaxID=200413 RepID=UPI000A523E43